MNRRDRKLFEIVETIYAAATDQKHWSTVLGQVADLTGSVHAAVSVHDLRARKAIFAESDGRDPSAFTAYSDYYHSLNPWMNAGAGSMHEGLVAPGEYFVSFDELTRTEFYSDFGRQRDVVHTAGAVLSLKRSVLDYISINRGHKAGAFGTEDLNTVQVLVPHLARALDVQRTLEFARPARAAWNRLGIALLIADERGLIIDMNDAAIALTAAKDGIHLGASELRFHRQGDATRFSAAFTTSNAAFASTGPIRIFRRSGKQAYVLLMLPLPDSGFGGSNKLTLIIISDPDRTPAMLESRLCSAFGLTPAEARVAAAVFPGIGVSAAADQLGVSRETAKAQLAAVFRKTDTRSQTELIRVIAVGLGLQEGSLQTKA